MLAATIAAAIVSTASASVEADAAALPSDYGSMVPINQQLRTVAQGTQDTAPPIGCFGERPSGTKNMCERAFYSFPTVSDVAACAKMCIADEKCVMFAWSADQTRTCRLSATCKQPTNTLQGFDGYFRTSSTGSCAPSPSGGSGVPGNWTRVFLDDAATKGAVCIDGTPGAFYIRTSNANGTAPSDPTKWVVFMEGGGWASSLDESVRRIQTDLGSSKKYPAEPAHMEGIGMFGTFDTHTIVYNKYCDGGSWSGAVGNPPITYKNTTLYFRGRGLLNGIFDELLENRGLDKAKEVLFAGCSAGGLTTYIHADWVAETLKGRAPSAKVVALADAMYSLDHVDFQQDSHWPQFMQWVYSTNDHTGASVNSACVSYMAEKYGTPKGNRSEGWRCMFGASVAPFVETPTFILNSKCTSCSFLSIVACTILPQSSSPTVLEHVLFCLALLPLVLFGCTTR